MSEQEIKEQFKKLYQEWDDLIHNTELELSSRTEDFIETKPYQQIIQLGKKALPLVMTKIEDGQFLFNHAALKIAGIKLQDITDLEKIEYEQDASEAILKWWHSHNTVATQN